MPQPQTVNLKIKGLYTAANDFTGAPEGALDVANDIVIDNENLAESRRGFDYLSGDLPLGSDRITQFTTYQDKIIAHYRGSKLAYYSAGWNTYSGTYSNPDNTLAKTRFFEANQNLYISTSTGVKKLDAYNSTPVNSGIPKGLDLELSLTGASGFFGVNEVATPTATTTNLSPDLILISDLTGITVGQYVSGTNIPAGTTVSSITESDLVFQTSGETTAGSSNLTNVVASAGIVAGQFVTGQGIVDGTRVVSVSGGGPYTVVISQAAIGTDTGVLFSFLSDPVITLSANATGSGAVALSFSTGSQVAYRLVWGIRDANNNLDLGAPTQFAQITNNTGSSANVVAVSTIPSGITTSHFYQLYRSNQTADASISPIDEEQLVFEGNPTNTDISNGYVTITDSTPDSLRGAFLYTSTSQEGITQQNDQAPYCKDFCLFKGFSLYANIKSKQRRKLTILAVGGSSGIALNDTIAIAGTTYTAKSSETISSGQYKLTTSGTPAQNISDTANSLIRVINRYSTNTTVYAYLLSGPTDLPGQILIEERGVGGSSFAVTASAHSTAFNPNLPTSGTTVSSSQDVHKNGIVVSKQNQPESVPSANLFFAGNASGEILRIIPLREYVIILKQDGIFRLTGTSLSTFSVSPFDLTTKLIAPESAVQLSNEVWGLFDQGVCSVSDTGVNVRSRPIEDIIRGLIRTAISTVRTISFAVGYETDRKYILSLPDAEGDTFCRQQFVFNVFTNTWTRWTRENTGGFVNLAEDKLYFGNGVSANASVERKTGTYLDYVEEGFAINIVSYVGTAVVLDDVSDVNIGDVLFQDATHAVVITAINSLTNTVTTEVASAWSIGAATIYPAINCEMQWKPITGGNPAFQRQYSEGITVFKNTQFKQGTLSFFTDISQSFEDVDLVGFTLANWGTFLWGGAPWGGVNRPRSVRFLVPQDKQVASQLFVKMSIRNGYSTWKAEGISISYNNMSQEIN